MTEKLVRAVEYWFGAVEETAGPLSWEDVPAQAREDVAFLEADTAPAFHDLAASLVTSL